MTTMASKLLKDLQVRNAKPLAQDYRLTDGEGLYLLVKPNGSKLWRYNYSFENNKYVYSIGKYPEISLERARILHQDAIRLKAGGINPVDQKRKAKLEKKLAAVSTFKTIAKEWLEKKKRELAEKTFEGVEQRIEKNLYPILGDMDIREIKKQDVASALKIADLRSPEVASRCLGYAKNIFEYAEDLGVIEFSVISSMTAGKFLTKYENERFAHITDPKRLKELLIAIDSYSGEYVVRQLLRLLPLVALRPTEVRAATWNEIDFEKKIWSIGKERMKMRKDHIVPLSSQALRILEELYPYTKNSKYIFQSPRKSDTPLSDNSINKALSILGFKDEQTGHGFRHIFSTTCHSNLREHQFDSLVIEACLSHKDKNKERDVYNGAKYIPERMQLMQWYANYLDDLKNSKN